MLPGTPKLSSIIAQAKKELAMPTYEVPVRAAFLVEADTVTSAGNLVDQWWRLLGGADVEKCFQMRQEGTILPQRWSIGDDITLGEKVKAPVRRGHSEAVQGLMHKSREKFKLDEASIRLIEEAAHEFENV